MGQTEQQLKTGKVWDEGGMGQTEQQLKTGKVGIVGYGWTICLF